MSKPFVTLVDLLRARAAARPDAVHHTFLVDGGATEAQVTYRALDRRARAIAAWLQAANLAGERVILLYPAGLDYVAALFGCFYAGAIAVPVPSIHSNRAIDKLRSIVADAQPRACLTSGYAPSKLDGALAALGPVALLRTDDPALDEAECAEASAEPWIDPRTEADQIAYLQYTSGSTSAPKGVMITHRNVLANLDLCQRSALHTAETSVMSWLPHFHDMGLIFGILLPIYAGTPGYLMSPAGFIQRPLRWLGAISRHRITHTAAPDFAYDLCVARFDPATCADLDLASWRVAISGAEPVRSTTIDRFSRAFAPHGFQRHVFCPSYGLAEATLAVTVGRPGAQPRVCRAHAAQLEQDRVVEVADDDDGKLRSLVGCGPAAPSARVVIADPVTGAERAPGEVGEIWVGGPSVSPGYWGRPAETRAVFGARLAGTDEGPFLRTGDLGAFHDGELLITGRRKDLIIIHGSNHYPQDIEQTAETSHPAIRAHGCAAFAVEADGRERLIVAAEVDRRQDAGAPRTSRPALAAEIAACVRRAVARAHDIDPHAVVLVRPGSLPKTTSGKLQRRACHAAYLGGAFEAWEGQDR